MVRSENCNALLRANSTIPSWNKTLVPLIYRHLTHFLFLDNTGLEKFFLKPKKNIFENIQIMLILIVRLYTEVYRTNGEILTSSALMLSQPSLAATAKNSLARHTGFKMRVVIPRGSGISNILHTCSHYYNLTAIK